MAKRGRKSRKKSGKKSKKNQVPLPILEHRFQKLGRLIGRRGGDNVLD